MKKLFLFSVALSVMALSACSNQYVHTNESRSIVYMGQPAADVYENFGKPTKIKRTAENEQILIYEKQEIEKDWAYRYFHSCKMQFYMVDDRVADWSSEGDICSISTPSSFKQPDYSDGLAYGGYLTDGVMVQGLPEDAFRDSVEQFYVPAVEPEPQVVDTKGVPLTVSYPNQMQKNNVYIGKMPTKASLNRSGTGLEDEYGFFDAPSGF